MGEGEKQLPEASADFTRRIDPIHHVNYLFNAHIDSVDRGETPAAHKPIQTSAEAVRWLNLSEMPSDAVEVENAYMRLHKFSNPERVAGQYSEETDVAYTAITKKLGEARDILLRELGAK